jgi:hypothetical protein
MGIFDMYQTVAAPWEKILDKRSPEILKRSIWLIRVMRMTVFHQNLESCPVRKIRLRYTRIIQILRVYHMSQNRSSSSMQQPARGAGARFFLTNLF